jgi:hypothetical protein
MLGAVFCAVSSYLFKLFLHDSIERMSFPSVDVKKSSVDLLYRRFFTAVFFVCALVMQKTSPTKGGTAAVALYLTLSFSWDLYFSVLSADRSPRLARA